MGIFTGKWSNQHHNLIPASSCTKFGPNNIVRWGRGWTPIRPFLSSSIDQFSEKITIDWLQTKQENEELLKKIRREQGVNDQLLEEIRREGESKEAQLKQIREEQTLLQGDLRLHDIVLRRGVPIQTFLLSHTQCTHRFQHYITWYIQWFMTLNCPLSPEGTLNVTLVFVGQHGLIFL